MTMKVMMEKERFSEKFAVAITENGYQWNTVYRGGKEEAIIIKFAYKLVGYTESY